MYLLLLKLKSIVHTVTVALKTCTAVTGLSCVNSSEQRDYKEQQKGKWKDTMIERQRETEELKKVDY